jgi:hypothetical protein
MGRTGLGWSTRLHSIREIRVQILARWSAISTKIFRGFSQYLHSNTSTVPSMSSRPLPSTSFPIHYSLSPSLPSLYHPNVRKCRTSSATLPLRSCPLLSSALPLLLNADWKSVTLFPTYLANRGQNFVQRTFPSPSHCHRTPEDIAARLE